MSLSRPKQETPLVEPFQIAEIVETIKSQATEIEKLRSEKERLLSEREAFCKLAENESVLKQENEKLKLLLGEEVEKSKRAERRAVALEQELQKQGEKIASQLSAEVDKIVRRLPSADSVARLSKTLKQAEDSASTANAFQIINWVVVALFVAVVGFCGYTSSYGRTAAENVARMVDIGIFNKDGVSVLQNSKSNAWYWEHQQKQSQ